VACRKYALYRVLLLKLVVCRVLCTEVVGATSSEGFLVFFRFVYLVIQRVYFNKILYFNQSHLEV